MDKYYKVVVNDFMATGGDGYDFSNAKDMYDTNIVMRDGIMEYWRKNGIDTNVENLLVAGKDTTIDKDEDIDKPSDGNGGSSTTKPNGGKLPQTGGVDSIIPVLFGLLVAGSGSLSLKNNKDDVA